MNDVQREALRLLKCGVSPVPIMANSKKARGSWKRLQDHRMDAAEVDRMFLGNCQIGVVCGAISGNLEVLDFDVPDLYPTWDAIVREELEPGTADSLMVTRTPSGGVHVLFRCENVVEGNQVLARVHRDDKTTVGIETRGEGGYVLVAPSGGYRVERGSWETLPILNSQTVDRLKEVARRFDEDLPARACVYPVPKGWGSSIAEAFNASRSWEQILEPHGWTFLRTSHSGRQEWVRPGKEPHEGIGGTVTPDGEVFVCFTSNASPLEPYDKTERSGAYSKFQAYSRLNHGGDMSAAARALSSLPEFSFLVGPYREGTSNVNMGGISESRSSAQKCSLLVGPYKGGTSNEKAASFKLIRVGDLLSEPEESTSYVVKDLLPSGGTSLVTAKPKVGKSTLARNLVVCVARGVPFLGRSTSQGPPIYLSLEEKRHEVRVSYKRMGASDERLMVHVGPAPLEPLAALARMIEEHAPSLVVIDPLFRFLRIKDGNDYAEVTRAFEPLVDIARDAGTHICLLHHMGKGERSDADAVLGSTGLFAAVDTLIMLNKTDGARVAKSVNRYGRDLDDCVLKLDPNTEIISVEGTVKEVRDQAAQGKIREVLESEDLPESEIRARIGGDHAEVVHALRSMRDIGQINRNGAGKKGDPYIYSLAKEEHFL